jgi:hypothetical protein
MDGDMFILKVNNMTENRKIMVDGEEFIIYTWQSSVNEKYLNKSNNF